MKIRRAFLTSSFLCAGVVAIGASTFFYADWKKRYPGTTDLTVGPAKAIALDSFGDAIVIGTEPVGSGGGVGPGPIPPLLASMNPALPAISEATGKIIKYDHDTGDILWQFDTNASITAWADNHIVTPKAVCVGADGYIYVAGQVSFLEMVPIGGVGKTPDIFLLQLSPTGGLAGFSQISRDYAQDVTGMVMNGSNIYLSGYDGSATGNHAMCVRYQVTGGVLSGPTIWTATGNVSEASAVDIDAGGTRLVLAGKIANASTDLAAWRITPSTMTLHSSFTWDRFGLTDLAKSVSVGTNSSGTVRAVVGGLSEKAYTGATDSNPVMLMLNLGTSSITVSGVPSVVNREYLGYGNNPTEGVVKVYFDGTNAYGTGTYGEIPLVYRANFATTRTAPRVPGDPQWHYLSTALGDGYDITMSGGKIFAIAEAQTVVPHLGYQFMGFNSGSGTPTVNQFVFDTAGSSELPATPSDLAVYPVSSTVFRLFGTGGRSDQWFTTAKEVTAP